ncbi:flagellar hook assembly protein FlgD [Metabacillus sp. RGM 3146]|uniref:flagellar hook assembly protein FlgD n=1 Tax=Metabacillus sp. RGM 3146 TaxID=3401092 RepID=UPI003B9C60C0
MVNSLDPNLYISNLQKTQRQPTDILGKDDFLKILMVQLQNQDPLNPMQDKDYIAQMATFSSLEQMTNMNSTMQQLVTAETSDVLLKYNNLLGKDVNYTYSETNDNGVSENKEASSIVKSITRKGNNAEFELADGRTITSDQITKMTNPQNG